MPDKKAIERRVAGGNVSATDPTTISGYASVIDEPYTVGEFVEVIAEGAFDKVMAGNPDIRLLFNHDPNHILARTKSGTLFVAANAKGLCFSGKAQARADRAQDRAERKRQRKETGESGPPIDWEISYE